MSEALGRIHDVERLVERSILSIVSMYTRSNLKVIVNNRCVNGEIGRQRSN